VAPDNIYETVLAEINQATTSIYYEGYTFNNAHLADAIVARMQANPGMTVTILLEGEPVGGIEDQEKWICQQIENAGGQVYFMYNDDGTDVHDRYSYQHGKWMIIDGQTLLTGSENLNYSSMPADDKTDGTEGNRGVWLITDAPSAIAHALDVFQHDLDPAHHRDLFRWTASDPTYGAPPPGFVPSYDSGGTTYDVQFPTPLTVNGTFSFEMVQSPENSLRDSDSLLGMVTRAGSGDTVLLEQLYEYTFWGETTSNPTADPNPRLEAYIEAARRGAKVRILLDSAYDDPDDVRGNMATCAYVDGIAASNKDLDLDCKLGNPAGMGIHNKMVLVEADGHGYVHTGSINGSENSSKGNREFAVQVQSDAAYDYLAAVFWYDWREYLFLPLVVRNLGAVPEPDLHIEALRYDTSDEYVQITNRGTGSQDMTNWKIQSVVGNQWYYFSSGYTLAAGASVYVHSGPDAYSSPPADLLWGHAYIWSNDGDKAILYNGAGQPIDSYCYKAGCP
jgi:Lamin Tail Domain/PLD-like domain